MQHLAWSKVTTLSGAYCNPIFVYIGQSRSGQITVRQEEIILKFDKLQKISIPLCNLEEIEVDEFFQTCRLIFPNKSDLQSVAPNKSDLQLENFGAKIEDFLLVVEYLLKSRVNPSCDKIISQVQFKNNVLHNQRSFLINQNRWKRTLN